MSSEITFSIKKGVIEAAAKFIAENNTYLKRQSSHCIAQTIRGHIRRMMQDVREGKDSFYFSTAGYTVLLLKESPDFYVCDVLVDVLVSKNVDFVEII